MSIDKTQEQRIVQKFLSGNPDYLRLALVVEEAVESLREEMAGKIYPKLRAAIGNIAAMHADQGWKVTDECKQYRPLFWRRLYKDQQGWNNDQFSGVWMGRWESERLALEVCAEGWPAGNSALDLEIRNSFEKFVKNQSAGLWREDRRNSKPSRRISWHFDGDSAFLIGNVETEVQRIEGLLRALVETIDQAEAAMEKASLSLRQP